MKYGIIVISLYLQREKILMVFIRPRILRSEKDEFNATSAKYSDTRQEQLNLSRFQESFDQLDRKTVLQPLADADLPRPFCQTAQCKSAAMMTK
jgi:general secretion pathway protein D